jgi:hypothetical protein
MTGTPAAHAGEAASVKRQRQILLTTRGWGSRGIFARRMIVTATPTGFLVHHPGLLWKRTQKTPGLFYSRKEALSDGDQRSLWLGGQHVDLSISAHRALLSWSTSQTTIEFEVKPGDRGRVIVRRFQDYVSFPLALAAVTERRPELHRVLAGMGAPPSGTSAKAADGDLVVELTRAFPNPSDGERSSQKWCVFLSREVQPGAEMVVDEPLLHLWHRTLVELVPKKVNGRPGALSTL